MADVLFPADEIHEEDVLPTMWAEVTLHNTEETMSSTGKLQFRYGVQVLEPSAYRGKFVFDSFTVGTDDNPNGFVANTMGAQGMKKLFKAAGLSAMNNVPVKNLLSQAQGRKFCALISAPSAKDVAAGFTRNRVRNFVPLGEQAPKVLDETKAAPAPAAAPLPNPPLGATYPAPAPAPSLYQNPGAQTMMVTCPKCGKPVPSTEAAGHIQMCTG